MITPRVTRLLRTPGLRAFQRAIALAAGGDDLDRLRDTLVIVSTSGAADQLRRSLEELWLVEQWQPSADELEAIAPEFASDVADRTAERRAGQDNVDKPTVGSGSERSETSHSDRLIERGVRDARVWPQIVTRAGLYRAFYDRLSDPPALLDDYAREVLFQRAAADAVASGDVPPFEVRPGLIPQMLSLYDALRRQHRRIDDFERLVGGALEAGADIDRGARRLLQQTRFLVSAFRAYETRLAEDGALDEHGLRGRLLDETSTRPIRRVIVTVPDQRADGTGLWPADFDLLTRIAGLESIDLIATESLLGTGYIERIFETLPGIDIHVVPDVEAPSPMLLAPRADGRHDPLHFTSRDREQELADIARRLTRGGSAARPSGTRRHRDDSAGRDDAARASAESADTSAAPEPALRADVATQHEGEAVERLAYDRMAVIYQRPLPYLYLARQVFGARELPWQAFDALPLAAEPYAAALDLVVTFALSDYTRAAGIALLRAPQFKFEVDGHEPTLAEIAACDAELRDVQFLGGRDRLHTLLDEWRTEGPPSVKKGERRSRPRTHAIRALAALVAAADALAPLDAEALPSDHLDTLQHFLDAFERRPHESAAARLAASNGAAGFSLSASASVGSSATGAATTEMTPGAATGAARREAAEQLSARHLRARAAVIGTIRGLRVAFATHGEHAGPFRDLAALVHRWLEGQTFNPRVGERGLHLVDVQAAIYGRFSHIAIAGVVEGEWPASSSRSIFYPSSLLRDLGWPAETDRRAAARAVFDDLLRLARDEVSVSVFALEHDAIVRPSPFVEDLANAGLRPQRLVDGAASESTEPPQADAQSQGLPEALPQPLNPHAAPHAHEELMTVPAVTIDANEPASWGIVRQARTAIADRGYHGWTGVMEPRAYSVTALDRYLQCPFKYFAASVLRLEEEPERRPGLTPLERGRFEHEVFQLFFERWDAAGRGAIDEASLETARAEFVAVVDEVISRLPPSERALERTRLLGSAVGSGLGERVFRFEAARSSAITERLLEYQLDGEYQLPVPAPAPADAASGATPEATASAAADAAAKTRAVRLRATADRIDLLADGTMRVIDYKTGKASTAASSIQLPVYKLCAEERLDMHRGRHWRVSEAGYLAFGRPEPFVPVVTPGDAAQQKVTAAIAKVVDVVDRIESGAFPVTPAEPHMCMFCGYAAVCRKDYVDDV